MFYIADFYPFRRIKTYPSSPTLLRNRNLRSYTIVFCLWHIVLQKADKHLQSLACCDGKVDVATVILREFHGNNVICIASGKTNCNHSRRLLKQPLTNTEQVFLHLIGIGENTTLQVSRRTRNSDYRLCDASACAAFCRAYFMT